MANFDLRDQQVGTQYVAGRDVAIYQQPLTITAAQQKRNRMMMLERMRSNWIKGVLDRSLSETPLALGLREHSDLVTGSLYRDLDEAGQYIRDLPLGTPILQVYTDAIGELLILGEPGSGKTTLLLELARDLLDQAAHDETHPIPVVFNLSSWALHPQPLSLWLVEELKRKYLVPHKQAESWVTNDQILPMLDGLDEVVAVHRERCVEEINAYHREHGLVPLIVSCRSIDYDTLPTRLHLHSTVVVQPLTTQQIDDYLTGAGEQTDALRLALCNDPVLQELVTTPLLLNIVKQTYQDKQTEDLVSTDTPAIQRKRILSNYVHRMLQRGGKQMRYRQSQVLHWLGWLARQLARHSQTEFSIERMQPDWLLEEHGQRFYERLGVRLPGVLFGIAVSLIVWIATSDIHSSLSNGGGPSVLCYVILIMFISGLIGGLFSENATGQRFARSLIPALVAGVLTTLVAALPVILNPQSWYQILVGGSILGLGSFLLVILAANGLIGRVNTEIRQEAVTSGSLRALWSPLIRIEYLRNGVVVGLTYGLAFLLDNLQRSLLDYDYPVVGSLAFGSILGISGIILSVVLGSRERTVQPVEVLNWSWHAFRRSLASLGHLRNGLLIGAACGLVFGLSVGLYPWKGTTPNEWVYVLSNGLAVVLSYWLFVAFLQGLSSGAILDEQLRITPNQGIRLSVRNGLFVGLVGAGVSGVFAFLAIILRDVLSGLQYTISLSEAWLAALLVALAGGLIVGLLNGWLAYIRHKVLRLLLMWIGAIPSNYVGFLDEAAGRVLLRKVGGSYMFVHPLLRDYFAKVETPLACDQ